MLWHAVPCLKLSCIVFPRAKEEARKQEEEKKFKQEQEEAQEQQKAREFKEVS